MTTYEQRYGHKRTRTIKGHPMRQLRQRRASERRARWEVMTFREKVSSLIAKRNAGYTVDDSEIMKWQRNS